MLDRPSTDSVILTLLSTEFALDVRSLEFVPLGEEGWSFIAQTRGGPYLVKLHHPSGADHIDFGMELVARLAERQTFPHVLAPVPTCRGALLARLGELPVSVRPYIAGRTADSRPLSTGDFQRVAALIASLHKQTPRLIVATDPVDRMTLPFEDEPWDADSHEEYAAHAEGLQAWNLLRRHAGSLEQAASRLAGWRNSARAFVGDYVITHGDLSLGNIMFEEVSDDLYLIDWSMACIAPAERDVAFFVGHRPELFLHPYVDARRGARLDVDLLAFYVSRWQLDAADFFWRRILSGTSGGRQIQHDMAQLAALLPIDMASTDAILDRIAPLLARTGQ